MDVIDCYDKRHLRAFSQRIFVKPDPNHAASTTSTGERVIEPFENDSRQRALAIENEIKTFNLLNKRHYLPQPKS